jgi:hypothetical protein
VRGPPEMVLQMPRPFKKPETGVYYLRRIVPADIRAITGKTEVRRSLKTKDPRTAARRFTEAAREVEKEWEELRREPESTAFANLAPQDLIEDAMGMEGILDERDAPEDWEPTPKALRTAIRARTGVSVALGAAEAQSSREPMPTTPLRLYLASSLDGGGRRKPRDGSPRPMRAIVTLSLAWPSSSTMTPPHG